VCHAFIHAFVSIFAYTNHLLTPAIHVQGFEHTTKVSEGRPGSEVKTPHRPAISPPPEGSRPAPYIQSPATEQALNEMAAKIEAKMAKEMEEQKANIANIMHSEMEEQKVNIANMHSDVLKGIEQQQQQQQQSSSVCTLM
jgi:hypothetical protein